MGLIKEFKEFAIKGNMVDMAVGIIIGAAFSSVVNVLVEKIIMPPLSLLTEQVKFSDKKFVLREEMRNANGETILNEVAIGYGALLEVLLNFLIIGFIIFLIVKFMNQFRAKAENPENKTIKPAKNIQLLENINTLLQEQNDLLRKNKSKRTGQN